MKGFKCGSNVGMFMGESDSAGKCIFNLLKVLNLCERKSVVKRVIIVKTRVDEGSGSSDQFNCKHNYNNKPVTQTRVS